jgi:hypothetical protein
MSFEVLRVDAVTSGNSNKIIPMLYFTPDLEFINYIKLNNNRIVIDISENDYYNGTREAIIDQSSITPNVRPNFYDATTLYVATLYNTEWIGYPAKMGKFSVNKNITKPESIKKLENEIDNNNNNNNKINNYNNTNLSLSTNSDNNKCIKDNKLSTLELSLIILIIFLIILLIFSGVFFFKNKNNYKNFL